MKHFKLMLYLPILMLFSRESFDALSSLFLLIMFRILRLGPRSKRFTFFYFLYNQYNWGVTLILFTKKK